METKACNKCAHTLPLDNFHKNRCTKDGLHTACKFCRCAYSAMTTDYEAKRAGQRRMYEIQRGHIKAKRVAFKMLDNLEDLISCWRIANPGLRKISSVMKTFVSDAVIQKISDLLETHIGSNRYIAGFGTRWVIRFIRVPTLTFRQFQDHEAFVRGIVQPNNIEFALL